MSTVHKIGHSARETHGRWLSWCWTDVPTNSSIPRHNSYLKKKKMNNKKKRWLLSQKTCVSGCSYLKVLLYCIASTVKGTQEMDMSWIRKWEEKLVREMLTTEAKWSMTGRERGCQSYSQTNDGTRTPSSRGFKRQVVYFKVFLCSQGSIVPFQSPVANPALWWLNINGSATKRQYCTVML